MLKHDNILMISIGVKPNMTCFIIHHAKFNIHIPYRYIKEFNHSIQINDEITYEKIYLHVLYKEYCGMGRWYKRNFNVIFFDEFCINIKVKLKTFL